MTVKPQPVIEILASSLAGNEDIAVRVELTRHHRYPELLTWRVEWANGGSLIACFSDSTTSLRQDERLCGYNTALLALVARYRLLMLCSTGTLYPKEWDTLEHVPIWRCTWCCRDTPTNPCDRCGNDHTVSDRTLPHRPEWSRKTINTAECKICDRVVPMEEHGHIDDMCQPTQEKPHDE